MVKDLELGRKFVHVFGYLMVFVLGWIIYNAYGLEITKLALFALLIVMLICDYLTTELGIKLPIYTQFQRKSEIEKGIHSATFGVIGSFIALSVFDLNIAAAAILMMIISDPASALLGKTIKLRILYKKKTLSGSSVALILNLLIAFLVLDNFLIIFGVAIGATLTELFVEKIDDNLAIPLLAGLAGQLLSYL